MSDTSKLQTLGIDVENEDPLPKNLANIRMMNHISVAVGNLVNPIACPCIQENCRNAKWRFATIKNRK